MMSKINPVLDSRWDALERVVMSAVGVHDLGKATNLFQGMLTGDSYLRKKVHPVRHEILSALLLSQIESSLKEWASETFDSVDTDLAWVVSWVAGGHHLKLHNDSCSKKETDRLVRVQGTPREFIFWGSHPDVKKILELTAVAANLAYKIPELSDTAIPLDEDDGSRLPLLEQVVEDYTQASERKCEQLSKEDATAVAIAKAIVISADVAGSALTNESEDVRHWVSRALAQVIGGEEIQEIIDDRLQDSELRYFQKQIRDSVDPVTLTIAGCGSGKTLAAYAWAKERARGKKLFFCYPTTGTASAGFEDYLLAQSSLERTLIHGKSQVDISRMLSSKEDGENFSEENQRLESLKAWSHKVIACTADTVLGLVQNQRRALFSFPAIAGSAFVFDEIHNYDSKMFGALLRFLQVFPRIPVILMSASIPENRMSLLKQFLGRRLGEAISGDVEMEKIERYKIEWQDNPYSCWPRVEDAIKNDQKVLWVCNTVGDATSLYEEAIARDLGVTPLVYHSRFRYKDRVERQASVIGAFDRKKDRHPALVFATQVCEMSLDISADLLVTALAPFSSLIQRMGRLNRYAGQESKGSIPKVCDCLVYDFTCKENKPYRRKDLQDSKKIVSSLLQIRCTQRQLAEVFAGMQQTEEIKLSSAWLDGAWQTDRRPLRDGGATLTVLLEEDVPTMRKELKNKGLKPNSRNVAAWTIPMLYFQGISFAGEFGGYPVASERDIEYDKITGARWRKKLWQTI